MGGLAALCLLLMFPPSSSQVTLQSERKTSPALPPPPPPLPHIRDLLVQDDAAPLNAKRTYAHVDKDNAKIFLFIAASVGTVALMAAVYCIYNNFYTKQQYLHTQLQDPPVGTARRPGPSRFFHGPAADSSSMCLQRSGYGSLADSPSIISVAPACRRPPAMPFPPLFLSSRSLRTISAQDLEKSCI